MAWEKPKYNKFEINNAGSILIDSHSSKEEKENALKMLDNWRAAHSYPMHILQMRLRDKSQKIDKDSIIAQRLKRVPAITYKLKRSYNGRKPSMKLFQMQDIGGCRAVLSNISQARKLCDEYYLKGDLKHKRVGYKDYIAQPKPDGYRSIHLVYEYKSNKGKQEFNGLLVEIQIRTKLQHLWATANETVELFTGLAIKTTEQQNEWKDFFKLVSSAFAKLEGCPCVEGTTNDEKELYSQIKVKESELKVRVLMKGWADSIQRFNKASKIKPKLQFFLLELDILGEKLNITGYTKNAESQAIEDYAKSEKRNEGKKQYDVVLVGADTTSDLEKAYPNYYADSVEFLEHLDKIIKKY